MSTDFAMDYIKQTDAIYRKYHVLAHDKFVIQCEIAAAAYILRKKGDRFI